MKLFLYMFFSALLSSAIFVTAGYLTTTTCRYHSYNSLRTAVDERAQFEKGELTRSLEAIYNIAILSVPETMQHNLQSYFDASSSRFEKIFIVTRDGSLLSHSDITEKIRLRNNINSNNIYYNRDLLLHTLISPTDAMRITDYRIVDAALPFDEVQLASIETNIYKAIRADAFLAQRKVVLQNGVEAAINIIASKRSLHGLIVQGFQDLERQLMYVYLIFSLSGILTWVLLTMFLSRIGRPAVPAPLTTRAYLPQELIYENREVRQLPHPEESAQLKISTPKIESAGDSDSTKDNFPAKKAEPAEEEQPKISRAKNQSEPPKPTIPASMDTPATDITDDLMDGGENDPFIYEESEPAVTHSVKSRGGSIEIIEHNPSHARIVIQDAIPIRKSSWGK